MDFFRYLYRYVQHLYKYLKKSISNPYFNCIMDKPSCRFIQFDIVEFYPSISKDLLLQALDFGRNYSTITELDVATIMNARKSLLFYNDSFWVKKRGDELFDVAMGSYDGAEIADLVGLFILHTLKNETSEIDIGLYRDDGLGIVHNTNGHTMDKLRKKLIAIFNRYNLKITVDTNLLKEQPSHSSNISHSRVIVYIVS